MHSNGWITAGCRNSPSNPARSHVKLDYDEKDCNMNARSLPRYSSVYASGLWDRLKTTFVSHPSIGSLGAGCGVGNLCHCNWHRCTAMMHLSSFHSRVAFTELAWLMESRNRVPYVTVINMGWLCHRWLIDVWVGAWSRDLVDFFSDHFWAVKVPSHERGSVTIGRRPNNTLVCNDISVSGKPLGLVRVNASEQIVDHILGTCTSTSGTCRNCTFVDVCGWLWA